MSKVGRSTKKWLEPLKSGLSNNKQLGQPKKKPGGKLWWDVTQ